DMHLNGSGIPDYQEAVSHGLEGGSDAFYVQLSSVDQELGIVTVFALRGEAEQVDFAFEGAVALHRLAGEVAMDALQYDEQALAARIHDARFRQDRQLGRRGGDGVAGGLGGDG